VLRHVSQRGGVSSDGYYYTFADACQVQAVTDAIYRSGRAGGTLVDVAQTT